MHHIRNQLGEVRKNTIYLPPLGLYPVNDIIGIGPALDMLYQSLDAGMYYKCIDFDISR